MLKANQKVTDKQVIDALKEHHGNNAAVAKALNVARTTIRKRRTLLIRKGLWGDTPEHLVPDGYKVHGKSILFKDGVPLITWVKSSIDNERQAELMRQVVEAFKKEMPQAPPTEPPASHTLNSLFNCYILTDYHLGMMAWGKETGGDDWDLQKAVDLLMKWIDEAVKRSPAASTGILAQKGDFMHWDGLDAVTPTSKHVLDADTRFQKVVQSGIMLMRYFIDQMLAKYDKVVLIQTGGNHDPASTVWMREFFSVFYQNEPRLYVDPSADLYFCYEQGETSLFFHHGHKRNVKTVSETFVTRFRKQYGRTKFSYGHIGHRHSDESTEKTGVKVEQHRTLAPPDAYSAHGGYSSGRDGKVITYHSQFGEVGRLTISPDMLK